MTELAEAHAAFNRLVLHLEAHKEHYANAFIQREDPALRMTRLTQCGVGPFVENQLLGFASTHSIFPWRLEALPTEVQTELETLRPDGTDDAPSDPEAARVTIPTDGIQSEVALGACDALEPHLVERRSQELRERDLRSELLEVEVEQRKREGDGEVDPEE